MGTIACKPCCPRCPCRPCCPCACCHAGGGSETPVPPSPPSKKVQWYQPHPVDPKLPVRLERRLDGKENPVFIIDSEAAPISDGGPEPKPPKRPHSTPHTDAPDRIQVPGKNQSQRLKNLRTKVSTHSFTPRSDQDLEVRKGDEVEVLEEHGPWILVKTEKDGQLKTGFIPETFLANPGSLEAQDWYFNLSTKMDAKRYLMQEQNRTGSFLVWKKVDEDCYFLSVRDDSVIRNYRIHELDGSFCLGPRASFYSITDLVRHYMETPDGLSTKLDKPCVKLDPPPVDSISYTMVNQLEIDPNTIKKVRRLGRGQFGQVWLGLWNGTTEVAIKELQVSVESLQKSLQEEARTMWRLSHERLLKLYAVCLQTQPVFIVTEYMKHGTLKRYLRARQELRNLEFYQLVDFAVQIAQGMVYMEQQGCVHRDLRSENILLSAMMSCKIGDFGLARFMDSSSIAVSADAQIPIKWTAPEVFLNQKYSTKSDVWSFGVLLGEIVTFGKFPFPHKTNGEYRQDILDGKPLEPPADSPPDMSYIMEMCWRHQSHTRPSFAEIEGFLMDLLNPILVDDVVE